MCAVTEMLEKMPPLFQRGREQISEGTSSTSIDSIEEAMAWALWPPNLVLWSRNSVKDHRTRGGRRRRWRPCFATVAAGPTISERRQLGRALDLAEATELLKNEMQGLGDFYNNVSAGLVRIEVELPIWPGGALAWLQSMPREEISVYFCKRCGGWGVAHGSQGGPEGHEVQISDDTSASWPCLDAAAGVGAARLWRGRAGVSLGDQWEAIHSFVRGVRGAKVLGGARFDSERQPDPEWELFGASLFVLPSVELSVSSGIAILSCNVAWAPSTESESSVKEAETGWDESGPESAEGAGEMARELLEGIGKETMGIGWSRLKGETERPDHSDWNASVRDVLRHIERGGMKKAVVARRKELLLESHIDPLSMVSTLGEQEPGSYGFALSLSDGTTFFGCTPERLLSSRGSLVMSEALAGTRPRHATRELDDGYAQELVQSGKEAEEHSVVKEGVRDALEFLCKAGSVQEQGCTVRKLSHLQHLYCMLEGVLERDASLGRLVEAMHPTAAVCGSPRNQALHHLRVNEAFDRGMYAGPFGVISADESELAVGIRSALYLPHSGPQLLAYGGVGIVKGADPPSEWREASLKMAQIERALSPPPQAVDEPNVNMAWSSLIIDELVRCGVRDFCVAPGSRSAPLALSASRHPSAVLHLCIDERSLGFFALGLGKSRRYPAAVITSSGTAVANLLPAAVEADASNEPLFLLTADRPPEMHQSGCNQTIRQLGIFTTCAREEISLGPPTTDVDARHVVTSIDEGVRRSTYPRPGPVHVNVHMREPLSPAPTGAALRCSSFIANKALSRGVEDLPYTCFYPSVATPSLTEPLRQRIGSSQEGIVVIASVRTDEDVAAAIEIAELLCWPLVVDAASGIGGGLQDERDRKNIFTLAPAYLAASEVREMVRPDCALQLGTRITARSTFSLLEEAAENDNGSSWIVVDSDMSRHDPSHLVSHRLEASPREFLRAVRHDSILLGKCSPSRLFPYFEAAERGASFSLSIGLYALEGLGLSEMEIAALVAKGTPRGGVLFCGNSMPIRDVDAYGSLLGVPAWPPRVASNRGASGIDGVVSTAIGVARGSKRRLTLVVGDISFHHDANGLRLLHEMEDSCAPVTIVVINNDGGKIFKNLPMTGHVSGWELSHLFETSPRISVEALCYGHNVSFARAETGASLSRQLAAASISNAHRVIEARVATDANNPRARGFFRSLATDAALHSMMLSTQLARVGEARVSDISWRLAGPANKAAGQGIIIRVCFESGHCGYGEARPHPHFNGEDVHDIEAQLGTLAQRFKGSSVAVGSAGSGCAGGISASLEAAGILSASLAPSLRFGLGTALLSAVASQTGQALADFVAMDSVKDESANDSLVPVNALIGDDVADVERAAAHASRCCYEAVKVKVGARGPEEEAQRVEEVRRGAGPAVKIRCDANRRFSVADALAFTCLVGHLGVDYIEEPVVGGEAGILSLVERECPVGIALDETVDELYSKSGLQGLADSSAVNKASAMVVKPSVVGGIEDSFAIIRFAHSRGMRAVVTSALETSVGLSATSCLALLSPDEYHGIGTLDYDALENDVVLEYRASAAPLMDAKSLSWNNNGFPCFRETVSFSNRGSDRDACCTAWTVEVPSPRAGVSPSKFLFREYSPVNGLEKNDDTEPVVVLHGFFGTQSDVSCLARGICTGLRRRVLTLDLPGHGASEVRSLKSLTFSEIVEHVGLALQRVCALPCSLVGYSMGGRIALALASQSTWRTRSCVALSASPGLADERAREERRMKDEELASALEASGCREFLASWCRQAMFGSLVEKVGLEAAINQRASGNNARGVADALRCMGAGCQEDLRRYLAERGREGWPRFLFVAGEGDNKFKALAREMGATVGREQGQAEVAIVPKSGHCVHAEAPEATTSVVVRFLANSGVGGVSNVHTCEEVARRG